MNRNCYDDVYCHEDPDCPLYETCQRIIAEKTVGEIIAEKFLGDLENWKPTGLQPLLDSLPDAEVHLEGIYDRPDEPGLSPPEET